MKKILKWIGIAFVGLIVIGLVVGGGDESQTPNTESADNTQVESPQEVQAEENNETPSQRNAVRKANSYLSFQGFSRTGLIKQLEFEGFTTEQATYAVDSLGL